MTNLYTAKPVAHRGKMVLNPGDRFRTYQPENHEWRDQLCDKDQHGRLIGKNPMDIPLDVLTAAGHPQASVRDVKQRLRIMHGVDQGEARHDAFCASNPDRLTDIRDKICLPCSSDSPAEVRRCAIYDCPAWQYRMGRNPHNPRRGKNPFTSRTKRQECKS
ncbi:hypothetical protein [Sinorhizobium fredii]|uniref:hypothetical protein n=1 Tax=Rhizobium fredii TaxID=380 RepID=UPI00131A2DBC|nr:hypothetical protein [Sinorhizobium fredii]